MNYDYDRTKTAASRAPRVDATLRKAKRLVVDAMNELMDAARKETLESDDYSVAHAHMGEAISEMGKAQYKLRH